MNRILFVDDEPLLLEALRNCLRGKRRQWDMVFAPGAAAGLEEMQRAPVDVIVSDIRMPSMDGAEFLARAALLCPKATRIILSGQMEEVALARVALIAHRYLAKPCDLSTLAASISNAIELQSLMSSEKIRACVGGIESLPTVPSVYRELNTALTSSDVSLDAVARIVEQDVSISAKVLQLVNSAFFGVPRQTADVRQAVRYLGLGTIRSLVLSYCVFDKLGGSDAKLAEAGHVHALRCARIARLLPLDRVTSELAFTAGLLHDIGSLILAAGLAAEYAAICVDAEQRGVPVHVVELERLGVTHAQVGAYLLGLWGLPHEVIDLVAAHHDPWTPELPVSAASAVRIAEAIALEVAEDERVRQVHAEAPPIGWAERLDLGAAVSKARALEAA